MMRFYKDTCVMMILLGVCLIYYLINSIIVIDNNIVLIYLFGMIMIPCGMLNDIINNRDNDY